MQIAGKITTRKTAEETSNEMWNLPTKIKYFFKIQISFIVLNVYRSAGETLAQRLFFIILRVQINHI